MIGQAQMFGTVYILNDWYDKKKKHLHHYKSWKSEKRVVYFRFAEAVTPCLFVPKYIYIIKLFCLEKHSSRIKWNIWLKPTAVEH